MNLADWKWLASPAGEAAIAQALESTRPLHLELADLRKQHGPARAAQAMTQAALRKKAAEKFGDAAFKMLWTDKLLQQATDRAIAEYKVRRFGSGLVYDLCCGAGGDLLALAKRGQVSGFDLSPEAIFLAQVNIERLGLVAKLLCADVASADVQEADAWHLDPDRRASGGRTSKLEFASPDLETIRRMLGSNPHAALKTAPADRDCELAGSETEMEWIGSRGECRQLVIWSGNLARHPGSRVATVVEYPDHPVIGQPHAPIELASTLKNFIHEPHAAVLGAEIENALAASLGAARVDSGAAYFTSETPSPHPALQSYRVKEIMPFDLKTLKEWVRERQIGTLEIKKRGVHLDPAKLRKSLPLAGAASATLLLTPHQNRVVALVVEREDSRENARIK